MAKLVKSIIESKKWRDPARRPFWAGVCGLVLGVVLLGRVPAGSWSRLAVAFREAPALTAAYLRSGEWQSDWREYVTQAEYLFCPESGAGARLDFEGDE